MPFGVFLVRFFRLTKFRQVSESGQIERTVVSVAVELLEVLKVDEVESLFSCQVSRRH